jgi:hypothetical protein
MSHANQTDVFKNDRILKKDLTGFISQILIKKDLNKKIPERAGKQFWHSAV